MKTIYPRIKEAMSRVTNLGSIHASPLCLDSFIKIPPEIIKEMTDHQRAWEAAYARLQDALATVKAAKHRVQQAVKEGREIDPKDWQLANDEDLQRSRRRSAKRAMKAAVEAARPSIRAVYDAALEPAEKLMVEIFEQEERAAKTIGIEIVPSRTLSLLVHLIGQIKANAHDGQTILGAHPAALVQSIVKIDTKI